MHLFPRLTLIALLCITGLLRADELQTSFKSPPDSARPQTWWHWMNGNVTREGITKDLEGMKRIGLGGFEAFSVTDRIPPGPVGYMDDGWLDLMQHAAKEADRLGLKMCMHNCAGWSSSGGPWITPAMSMQEVVWTETHATGGKEIQINLPQPQAQKDFYRDIAVVAFPTLKGDANGKEGFRLSDWTWKIDSNTKGRRPDSQIVRDVRTAPAGDVIHPKDVVILSDKMDTDGKLKWNAPPGDWTIVRFGHTSTGRTNHPAPPAGEGLECNKLDRAAVKYHWDHSVARVIERAGPLVGKTFDNVLIDSYEVGFQNWTSGFDKIFAKRVGYEMLPYLPCLTGRVVENVDTTERFLWDYRRVIADLMAENYFGYFAELCHQNHMMLSIEPYGPGGFDDFQIATIADIPMGEFWVSRPNAWHTWSVKMVASAAHALGRPFAGAESFTASPPASAFRSHPYTLASLGNQYFANGLNRIIFHTCVHQPWSDDVLPGMTMGPHGTQMNRHNTWYFEARPWIDNLARTQYLLQQGHAVADLCYLASEDAPQTPLDREALTPPPPTGFDYDMLHASLIMQLSVKDGRLVLPSGMSYRMLILPPTDRMRPALLEKIAQLARDGASIYGPRPVASPSLEGQPKSDERVRALAEELWGGGKILFGESLEDVLAKMTLAPDVQFVSDDADAVQIDSVHRRTNDADLYFVANRQHRTVQIDATFRATGAAQIWHPENGSVEPVVVCETLKDDRMRVPLRLEPAQSLFVVFHEKGSTNTVTEFTHDGRVPSDRSHLVIRDDKTIVQAFSTGTYRAIAEKTTKAASISLPEPVRLTGPWTLHFPAGWGAPDHVELAKLISWTEQSDPEIQHFSGTATYNTTFTITPNQLQPGALAMLDLGNVQVMATVKLNGQDLGLLWKPPFIVDVTKQLHAGDNQLEVRVTNLWINRLIGDEAYPPQAKYDKNKGITKIPQWLLQGKPRPESQRKTFITWRHYSANDPLAPSGLIGPVRLIWGKEVEMK